MEPRWYVLLLGGYDAPELFGPFATNDQANAWAIQASGSADEVVIFDLNTAANPEA